MKSTNLVETIMSETKTRPKSTEAKTRLRFCIIGLETKAGLEY